MKHVLLLLKRNVLRFRFDLVTIYYMNKLNWIDYLNRLPGNPSDRAIAAAAETSPSTVSRWKGGQTPDPLHVTRVARAFGQSPLNALFNAGFLSLDEVDAIIGGTTDIQMMTLNDYSTAELAEEIARRARAEERSNGLG
jgi:transcriptional regulator with XRE-family HTH domain